MAESASHIAREAAGLHQGLKELLRSRDPWDRDVEFQRNNLRRHYLRLILVHPSDPESRDAETRLWMQTSHQFISTYRDRLKALDHILQSTPRTAHNNNGGGPRQAHAQGNHGPVEYRKLMQRFRQFLATEEKFWTAFVARCFRSFALQEAAPALATLGILTDPSPETASNTAHSHLPDAAVVSTEMHQAQHNSSADSTDGSGRGNGGGGGGGRNQNHFPPESSSPPAPQSASERASRIADLSKALVYLGDLARYRELYNESGGRPKAGHEDNAPARRGRNRRRGGGGAGQTGGGGASSLDNVARARDYSRAIALYEQARLLVPSEGNPSNQLAILAQYQRDWFTSLYHHYKALCVRRPFETAADNMRVLLSKQLKLWRDSGRHKLVRDGGAPDGAASSAPVPVPVRIEQFKEQLVLLHASWQLANEKFSRHVPSSGVADDFASLVSERHLLTEVVSKVIVLAQGALWKHRMIRDPAAATTTITGGGRHANANANANASASSGASSNYTPPPPHEIESRIATHVLDLHCALLQVGTSELAEAPPDDAAVDDLAQRITATFRRTLPALRIANKWLVANGKYVIQHSSAASFPTENGSLRQDGSVEHGKGGRGGKGSKGDKNIVLPKASVSSFWAAYASFFTALANAFPMCRLKAIDAPLDEDVDMRGFLPLRGLMYGDEVPGELGVGAIGRKEGRHPNEEMLMRIWDLLNDAQKVAEMENSPVTLQGRTFSSAYATIHKVSSMSSATNPTASIVNNGIGISSNRRSFGNAKFEARPAGARGQNALEKNKPAKPYSDDAWRVSPPDVDATVSTDEDAMTNRTDEDIIREAISAAVDRNSVIGTDEEMDLDEEDDEIVWNPRTPKSPKITMQDHSHPQSPISPMLSPKTPHARATSLTFGPADLADVPAMASISSRARDMPRPAPSTTAEDLLNNVMGLGLSRSGMGAENNHALPPPNSPPRAAIWGESSITGQQSIWSVSLGGGGGGSQSIGLGGVPHHHTNSSLGQSSRGHGPSALRHGHPGLGLGHSHTMSYSHSPSQSQSQQSIWAPAFESTQNGPLGQQQQQQQQLQQQNTRFFTSPLRSPPRNTPPSVDHNLTLSQAARNRSFSTGANIHYSSGTPGIAGLRPSPALSPPRYDPAPPGWPPAQNAGAASPGRLPTLNSPFMAHQSPPSGSPHAFSDPAIMSANPGIIGGGVSGGAHYNMSGNIGLHDRAPRGDGNAQYGLDLGPSTSMPMELGAHHQRIPSMYTASPIWSKHG